MIEMLNKVEFKLVDLLGKKKDQRSRSKRGGGRVVKVPSGTKKHTLNAEKGLMKLNKDIPMSNFDLLDWCKYLKIPINNV